VARAARKSRRRFGGALEPLTEVQARWSEREGRDLHRIDALELIRSHSAMQSDPALQAVCAVLSEVAAGVAREAQADPQGFRLMGAVLRALESGTDPWVAVRYFEYWTLRLHGLLPDLSSCGACGNPIARGARAVVSAGRGVVCARCCGEHGIAGQALAPGDAEFLERAACSKPEALDDCGRAARPGGAVEELLKGALEAFVERTFRAYRHLAAVGPPKPSGRPGS
jgi:DNA repair protein RecO (recombination protein O)